MIYDIDPLLVDIPIPIITPRLLLRPLKPSDRDALIDAKKASWPELQKWMDWASDDNELTPDQNEIVCRKKQAAFILREDLQLLILDRDENKIIGSTGLHDIDWRGRVFGTGYWIRSDETNKGYATEATNAVVRYAFQELKANRLYIGHHENNHASKRVIEKLGFVKEGVTKNSSVLNNELVTSCHYGRYDLDGLPNLNVSW